MDVGGMRIILALSAAAGRRAGSPKRRNARNQDATEREALLMSEHRLSVGQRDLSQRASLHEAAAAGAAAHGRERAARAAASVVLSLSCVQKAHHLCVAVRLPMGTGPSPGA